MKLFFEYLIEDWMSVATFTKYLLKALAISCGSVKLRPLSKILDGATLGNSFKDIRFFIPFMYSLSLLGCFGFLLPFIRVDNRFLYCLYLN